jgi:hypothetical protein
VKVTIDRQPVARVVTLARRDIREGRFQRTMALIAAFSAIVSGFEAYAQHLRGAFRDWLMWTPVFLTPPVVVAALVTFVDERAARRWLPIVSVVSLIDGLIGFWSHLRGIQKLPGGFRLGQYNVVIGPPIFAPLLVGIVGILGLFASFLRSESGDDSWTMAWSRLAHATWPGRSRVLRRGETEIAHGQFQQAMAVTAATLAVLSGGEAYFEHLRGSFNQRFMWTPVWVTPPMVVAAIGAAHSERIAHDVLPVASAVTFFDGLLGFWLHLRGLKRMPGGFSNIQFNVVAGPPMFAPLLFSAVGLLGLTASLLRRGRTV